MTYGSTKENRHMNTLRIEVGLDVIYENLPDNETLTLREIADICGVDHSRIWQIQNAAISKLRKAMNE